MNPPQRPIKIQVRAKDDANPVAAGEAPSDDPPSFAPTNPAAAAQDAPTSTPNVQPAGAASKPARMHWSKTLTHPLVTCGVALVSLAFIVWNLAVRLPGHARELPIFASSATGRIAPGDETTLPLTVESIDGLRADLEAARGYLVQGEKELVQLISRIEALAARQGWRAQLALNPPQSPASAPRLVAIYPARVVLDDMRLPNSPGSAYQRLLNLLDQIQDLQRKLEWSSINLAAAPDGLTHVDAVLNIWTQLDHATPAAK